MTEQGRPAEGAGGDRATLRDGTEVEIVPIDPADAERLVRFHGTLSPETTRFRFFSFHPELSPAEVDRFTHVDHVDREAFVAVHAGEIVGVARFDRERPHGEEAEVAFVVSDPWQGRGLGTALFDHLKTVAQRLGVRRLTAYVLRENWKMLAVFRHAGLAITERGDRDVVRVTMTVPDP